MYKSTFWFKEYIKTMTLKAGLKKCKTYHCVLYGVNELGTLIIIVYIYYTLEIEDKKEFVDTIKCIKK